MKLMSKMMLLLVLGSIAGLATPQEAEASHYRFGHISWTRADGTNDVTFTVTTAWRSDFVDGVNLTFGDGTSVWRTAGSQT